MLIFDVKDARITNIPVAIFLYGGGSIPLQGPTPIGIDCK